MIPRDPGDALLADFSRRLGPLGDIDRKTIAWHSATFAGERHEMAFTVEGDVDCSLRNFVRTIGEAEIALRRGFVADVTVVETSATPGGTRLRVEALTIDDD